MDRLKKKFYEKSSKLKTEVRNLRKNNGAKVVDKVNIAQIIGGMRGIKSMLWETSELDANKGITFRGHSIPQIKEILPKKKDGGKEPLPEGLFWLMLVNEIPTQNDVEWLSKEWFKRSKLPQITLDAIASLPVSTHPMTQFIIGINSMQADSVFSKRYAQGMNKNDYWDATYEDAMNLIARLPRLAAYIYRRVYHDGIHIAPNPKLDWAGNYAHMLGINDGEDFKSLMRLYLTIHADHEGGNASAHTAHLVNSTLADVYLSFGGAMASLAGPLHGLANQEVIKWIFEMTKSLKTTTPTDKQVASYINKTLKAGKVIPGYGHAVLREPDPRFTAQRIFAEDYIKDDDYVKIVWQLFRVVPPILGALGKVKNPWPNVDAHSGAILVHFGLKEYTYYTVLFGVSRALGVLANSCWSRAYGLPLERPKSVNSIWLKEQATGKKVKTKTTKSKATKKPVKKAAPKKKAAAKTAAKRTTAKKVTTKAAPKKRTTAKRAVKKATPKKKTTAKVVKKAAPKKRATAKKVVKKTAPKSKKTTTRKAASTKKTAPKKRVARKAAPKKRTSKKK